jgi:hypothetical protein
VRANVKAVVPEGTVDRKARARVFFIFYFCVLPGKIVLRTHAPAHAFCRPLLGCNAARA